MQLFVGEKLTMNNRSSNWSRKPSSDNVSDVFIYSNYDQISEDDKLFLPTMLGVYTEIQKANKSYEKRKTFLILGISLI